MALQVVQKSRCEAVPAFRQGHRLARVQIALLTERINSLTEHFKTHVKDSCAGSSSW